MKITKSKKYEVRKIEMQDEGEEQAAIKTLVFESPFNS